MSPASLGALHSMLGAMDKRVSEEVRTGAAWTCGCAMEGTQCPQPAEFEHSCFMEVAIFHLFPPRA